MIVVGFNRQLNRFPQLIRGLGDGSIHGLASCDVISEGTDIPAIACAMMLRPTQSLGLYLQQGGRALRPSEGKEYAVILDHAGNTHKHGFLDDPREWSLNAQKKKKRRKQDDDDEFQPTTQCEKCYRVYPSVKKICPACGHMREIKARELAIIEGKLKKVDEAEKRRIKIQMRKEVGMAKTLADLEKIEKQRQYKPGWARHVFASRKK